MPCPHDNLPLLAADRLNGLAKWRAERHVKSCPDCTAELARLSSLSGQLRTLTLSEPSADLDERVLTFRPEKRQAPSARPEKRSLRGLLLALPFVMALLAMGAVTSFILSTAHDECWVSELKIVWKAPTKDAATEARSLDLQIDALHTEPAAQNIRPSFDNRHRVNQVEISHRIEGDREVARRVFQTWIDRIIFEGNKKNHGWAVKVSRSPHLERIHVLDIARGRYPSGQMLSWMLPVSLFYSALVGLTIGFFLSLAIWIFRMGGFGALLVGATLGILAGSTLSMFQKDYYAADGQMDARMPNIVALAQSEEMQRDLRHDKIYTLSVDILPGTDTVRFRATGLYANYTAATVNLWMKRVQERALKDWNEKERPSRVDEMNPPVRIASEAIAPEKITQPNRRGTVAIGLLLGCAFGGFFGFARRRDEKPRFDSPERSRRSDHSAGENPMRIPISIVVGIGIGSSFAMLRTLFQTPVYQSTGRVFVKTQTLGSLKNVVELAKTTTIRDRVIERLRNEKLRAWLPEMKIESIEKTTMIDFQGREDDPNLVAQATNDLMEETVLVAKKNGIQASIVDHAIAPISPVSPNKPGNIVFGAGLGGLIGMFFGLFRRR